MAGRGGLRCHGEQACSARFGFQILRLSLWKGRRALVEAQAFAAQCRFARSRCEMSLRTGAYKIYLLALMVGFGAWIFHSSPKMAPDERRFAEVVGVLFLFYLSTPAVFEARVEPAEDGLHVEQYGNSVISYSEIRRCFSLYLFPWQVVIVTTKRRFPSNILIIGDKITAQRHSLLQDGEIAVRVKARMASSATSGSA